MKETPERKRVLLTITGTQTDSAGNSLKTEAQYEALYSGDGTGHTFSYIAEGDEAVLYLSSEIARMERGGKGGTRMVFNPAVSQMKCDYVTPFGIIPMEIRTERIVLMGGNRGAGDGDIRISGRIRYVLRIEGDEPLNCSVTIKAQQID